MEKIKEEFYSKERIQEEQLNTLFRVLSILLTEYEEHKVHIKLMMCNKCVTAISEFLEYGKNK